MIKPKMVKSSKKASEAMVKIPMSSLKYISGNSNNKKIIIEISIDDIKRVNTAETFDQIVNEARYDYLVGNYKTFTDSAGLVSELHS